jgi:hypothetical protein
MLDDLSMFVEDASSRSLVILGMEPFILLIETQLFDHGTSSLLRLQFHLNTIPMLGWNLC